MLLLLAFRRSDLITAKLNQPASSAVTLAVQTHPDVRRPVCAARDVTSGQEVIVSFRRSRLPIVINKYDYGVKHRVSNDPPDAGFTVGSRDRKLYDEFTGIVTAASLIHCFLTSFSIFLAYC